MSGESSTQVQPRRLNPSMRLFIGIATLLTTLGYGYFLHRLNGQNPYIDSISTILSIVAMVLMVKAYSEQWALWICVNAVTVALWLMLVFRQEPHAVVMVMMWSVYLVNSIYGWMRWTKKIHPRSPPVWN